MHRQILAAAQERDADRCATALAAQLARVARMVAARAGETAALPAIDAAVARATATG